MRRILFSLLFVACLLSGCAEDTELPVSTSESSVPTVIQDPEISSEAIQTEPETVYPDPQDMVFVAVADYIPDIQTDLKYATADNFTGQVIYEFSTVYLRYGTVKKLAAVQEDLNQLGMGLMIWDGFRPVSAQYKLWEVCPDRRYVANPNTGFSSHSRGNTVDVTLVDAEGREMEMPTGFDDFSKRADRDYTDCTRSAADNALILEALMEKHGFSPYKAEWWHYSDTEVYPVEEQFYPTN